MRNPDSAFLDFVRLVVAGDIDDISRRLADSPALATAVAFAGATRQKASSFFFEETVQKGVHMAEVTSISVEDQTRAIENWGKLWSAHDLDRLLQLFTEDVVYEDVTMGVVNRGKSELRTFGEGFIAGFPDVTFELRSRFANGASGGAEWVMRGTHTGDSPGMPRTGKHVEVRGASMFEFAGDKIRRCSDYWDMSTFLKQLGLA
jgi:steroid delta-isomerase-like uncharacterized protein